MRSPSGRHDVRGRARGQILVIFALGMLVLGGGVALILDGGNAYVQQRSVQNATDASANAAADVIALWLIGQTKGDSDVADALNSTASLGNANATAYYTDVRGNPLNTAGAIVAAKDAARVGGNVIPWNAQGVHVVASRTFGTTFARLLGMQSFTASSEAVAVAGRLSGGAMFPVVFPVNITDCSGNGDVGIGIDQWPMSQPDVPPKHPMGQEYIVPLCMSGEGSFMVLDLDGVKNNCADEVKNPTFTQFLTFPVDVASDNGNNCAKQLADAVNQYRKNSTVLIPICDDNACNTSGGTNATYHITGVVAFYIDYMSESNSDTNAACKAHTNADGQTIIPIAGNGSSSCLVGWFVRFVGAGPVGEGPVTDQDAVGIQLIK